MAETKYLNLAGLTTYDAEIKKVITAAGSAAETAAKNYADGLATNYDPAGTAATVKTDIEGKIGKTDDLTTVSKNIVGALEEIKTSLGTTGEAGKVTIATAETATEGYLKTYVFSQNATELGKIDIPRDLVTTGGELVVDPEGQAAGTYLKLTIANQETPVYINVADLVDAYTAAASATEVQVAISDTNEVSATLVDGGVSADKLASNAVTTAKIVDGNVTLAKLAEGVQTSLGKADTALQSSDLVAIKDDEIKALFA